MNNYLAKFSNKRELSFPATTLHKAKVLAEQYANKHQLYVSRVVAR